MPSAPSEYLTVRELAGLLNISRKSLHRWTVSGWLPAPIRLGPSHRWLRWKRSEVERFLRRQTSRA
jgi:excisionase family DNA binding protein